MDDSEDDEDATGSDFERGNKTLRSNKGKSFSKTPSSDRAQSLPSMTKLNKVAFTNVCSEDLLKQDSIGAKDESNENSGYSEPSNSIIFDLDARIEQPPKKPPRNIHKATENLKAEVPIISVVEPSMESVNKEVVLNSDELEP